MKNKREVLFSLNFLKNVFNFIKKLSIINTLSRIFILLKNIKNLTWKIENINFILNKNKNGAIFCKDIKSLDIIIYLQIIHFFI